MKLSTLVDTLTQQTVESQLPLPFLHYYNCRIPAGVVCYGLTHKKTELSVLMKFCLVHVDVATSRTFLPH